MQIELLHPKTNEVIKIETEDLSLEQIETLYKPSAPKSKILNAIDNLNLPAEAKAMLSTIADISIKVGQFALGIGQKILELIILFVKKYPNTAAGLVVGALIGLLIGSIPVIGWLLGWLIIPLTTAMGLAIGFWMDMEDKALKDKIGSAVEEMFGAIKNIKVPA